MSAVETVRGPEAGRFAGRRVLFVDDEPHLLAALRRTLRSQRGHWDISFASSGVEALQLIEEEPVDAIVSDMRMPGMDGAQLLAEVQRASPATARIILSGEADLDSVLAVLRSAQQFLAKPCDVQTLTGAVDQALRVQRLLGDPAVRDLIGGVVSLPTLPAVYQDLMAAADSPEADLEALSAILASDVGTSAELMKLVNSDFFGLPEQLASVESAVTLLGLDNVQALVLAGSVFRSGGSEEHTERLQQAALRRAAIARAVATREGWAPHERNLAVLSCMLRDVGGLILAEGMPAAANRLARAVAEAGPIDPGRRGELEIGAYGCTVPQASAYLLGLWGFAPAVVHTVAGQPLVRPGPGTTHLEYVLAFADLRVLHPTQHVAWPLDDYLTSDRLRDWNTAVDGAIVR